MKEKTRIKGQVALEFIMTYGWALLLIVALIGGLIYIAPSPKSLVANKCLFGSGIACLGSQFSADNLTIVLGNGMGQSIYNVSINITYPLEMACNVSNTTIRSDERLIVVCNNSLMNLQGDTRIKMTMVYKKVKTGYDQAIIGELYAKYN